MSQLTPEISADVVAACQAGAEEAAAALSGALDGQFSLEVGEADTYSPESAPAGFDGAGLVAKLVLGSEAVVIVLPAATGFVPDWCKEPDATGASKLATLAQELGMLLLPASLFAEDVAAAWADNIAAELTAGGVADGASCVTLTVVSGEERGDLLLLWPAPEPGAMLAPPTESASPAEESPPPAEGEALTGQASPPRVLTDFHDLPVYARSLLTIKVPVMVTLAEKREELGAIVDLGPGSILTFEKPCDAPLNIEVGGQPVATGEAVKVGEKFGIRVLEMVLPGERFHTMLPNAG